MRRARHLLAAAALVLLASPHALARDWHVAADAPAGGDGSVKLPFALILDATNRASPGDQILLAAGVYFATQNITVGGKTRRALLVLPEGVAVIGAGRGHTILRAPTTDGAPIFGITAQTVSRSSSVRDLSVDGPCFHGVNLRGASPLLERLDLQSTVNGTSSTAFDARDGSDPLCIDILFDGGHSAVFVEFGSSGTYRDCRIERRPRDGAAISDANPTFVRCTFEAAGRDGVVLNIGSRPRFTDCQFARADRWTVRIASGYSIGDEVDMSGNRWFSNEVPLIESSILDVNDNPVLGARVIVEPFGATVPIADTRIGSLKSLYRQR